MSPSKLVVEIQAGKRTTEGIYSETFFEFQAIMSPVSFVFL